MLPFSLNDDVKKDEPFVNFSLSDEQKGLKQAAVQFAKKELNEDMIKRDSESLFSFNLWKKCADFGIQGLPIPRRYGGQGMDILTSVIVMEGLGYGCKDSGLVFGLGAQMWDVEMPLMSFGSEELKKRYLPDLCNGRSIGAIAMTEPDSGSDAFSLKTSAKKNGNYYLLNGSKTFVTNGPVADVFIIFANVNKKLGFMGITAFIVEKDFPGLSRSKNIKKMGLKTNPWGQLIFDDCKVPVENRLGEEGNGVVIFNELMELERSCILAAFIGSMERQLEECIKYANSRRQFNKPIGSFQAVANKIVDMKIRLETSRLILYRSAWSKENDVSVPLDAAMTKLYLSEAWVQSCLDALQVHGGYGYTIEFELERELRDSLGSTLFAGTSEIQRNIIAKEIGL